MESHARIVARSRRGTLDLIELRSAPPLTLRRTGPNEVAIVSSAAWPVGGDAVTLDIDVGPGAMITIVTVAAALAYPSPSGALSSFTVTADVAAGATLRWLPEPTVLLAGCDHRATSTIRLAAGTSLLWREEVRLGRAGEPSGSLLQRLAIDRADRPFMRNEIAIGLLWPAAVSPASIGEEHVAVGSAIEVGAPSAGPDAHVGHELAWSANPLADDATVWTAVSTRMSTLRGTLQALTGTSTSLLPGSVLTRG